jgi:hypothetical protein
MTPREKAKELYEKIYFLKVNKNGNWMFKEAAKQCAIICLYEIIAILDKEGYDECDSKIIYWQQVAEEINKL